MTAGLLSLANFGNETIFSELHFGGGGYLTGLDIAPDSTLVVWTDVAGAYVWDTTFATPQMRQLITQTSMPAGYSSVAIGAAYPYMGGVWSVRIAYSNTQIFYMINITGDLFFSNNQGKTWYKTNFPTIVFPSGQGVNDASYYSKLWRGKLIVDPNNPDVVYVPTTAGIYRSINATSALSGTDTWSLISTGTIPAPGAVLTLSQNAANATNVLTFGSSIPASVVLGMQAIDSTTPSAMGPGESWAVTAVSNANPYTITLANNLTAQANSGDTIKIQTMFGGLAFDAHSGTTTVSGQTRTAGIYIPVYGKGIWHSTDGGQTWTQIANGTSSPVNVVTSQIDSAGVLFCSENQNFSSTNSAVNVGKTWMYRSGTWTELKPAGSSYISGACCVQNTPGNVWLPENVAGNASSGYMCINYGASFQGQYFTNTPTANGYTACTAIPWMASYVSSPSGGLALGDMQCDPNSGLTYCAEGVGIWKSNAALPTNGAAFSWVGDQTLGIEELVTNQIVCPPGGQPVIASWDRPVWSPANFNTFPSSYGTQDVFANAPGGAGVDWASSVPTFLCCRVFGSSGYSTDGGQTWNLYAGSPPSNDNLGGGIAASTDQNQVMVAGNSGGIWYTTNQGATWTACPGLPTSNWIFAYYINARVVAADRVQANTFYAYHENTGVGTLYCSVNGGAAWTSIGSFGSGGIQPAGGSNMKLHAAPGNAGHLWYSVGVIGGASPPANTFLAFSSNALSGGSANVSCSFTAISKANGYAHDIKEVVDFDFGKAPAGGTGYPAIVFYGWVDGVAGYYTMENFNPSVPGAETVTLISLAPNNNTDQVNAVCGDLTNYGRYYVGFGSSGTAVGNRGRALSGPPNWTH